MTDRPRSDELLDLIDQYLAETIDDKSFARLEALLLESEEARRRFVLYLDHDCQMHFATRARRSTTEALERLAAAQGERDSRSWFRWSRLGVAGAILLLLLGGGWMLASPRGRDSLIRVLTAGRPAAVNVAWLVNAQDCEWSGPAHPGRDMTAGKTLRLARGLAELEFDQGARVILQGPAVLELISGSAAKLLTGSLTARVAPHARGFTVLSPDGKVVDLGTEFGLSVDSSGSTLVRVFRGEVVAFPLEPRRGVTLHQNEAARIDRRSVALEPPTPAWDRKTYVRSIKPAVHATPHTIALDFSQPQPGTLLDRQGRGVGLPTRLPGTGFLLPPKDPNLYLKLDQAALELDTTRSDLNTQEHIGTGEYIGFRLRDHGFTGPEDFEISALIPKIPGFEVVGQFGLFAGPRSTQNIRGGLIRRPQPELYRAFLVNNHNGIDTDIHEVGLTTTGDDLRLLLRRTSGRYALEVENLTRHSSSTLAIAHPSYLDQETDLYVGLFGANTQSQQSRTLTIREVRLTVWTAGDPGPTIERPKNR